MEKDKIVGEPEAMALFGHRGGLCSTGWLRTLERKGLISSTVLELIPNQKSRVYDREEIDRALETLRISRSERAKRAGASSTARRGLTRGSKTPDQSVSTPMVENTSSLGAQIAELLDLVKTKPVSTRAGMGSAMTPALGAQIMRIETRTGNVEAVLRQVRARGEKSSELLGKIASQIDALYSQLTGPAETTDNDPASDLEPVPTVERPIPGD